jgi:hypothetical protein
MTSTTTVLNPPDVARISEGLRDTGYDFNTAVADVIDNSLAADATVVDVRIAADFAGAIVVTVSDNGTGMDRDGLINAMKYGSKPRLSAKSLGKFGMGLKTASTAFCKRLSLISRASGDAEPLRATWDLDRIAHTGSWDLEIGAPEPADCQLLDQIAPGASGTVVLWEKVDRLLDTYKDRTAAPFRKGLERLVGGLREHVSVVYQRFLDPQDEREKNVVIRVNGTDVKAWDPFCVDITTSPVAEKSVDVDLGDGQRSSFRIRAFVLPRREEFPDVASRDAARIANERQGIYVYRENRLIHGPDWLGMFKQEPHFSLARVELSFDHTLDAAFQVDIKKSRILLNESLYDWLREKFLTGPRREAEVRYRRGVAATATGSGAVLHTTSSNQIQQKGNSLSQPKVAVVNASTGEVAVDNKAGSTTATIRLVPPTEVGPLHIITKDNLENGVLWEPAMKAGALGVALNTGHPFYNKAYLPNKENSPVIQALDYLLWAIATAELDNINDTNKDTFEEFRVEVSRNLKRLVADLPDPASDEG